jgi:uncharacterized membrane protein YbhN (UPF0104 family)
MADAEARQGPLDAPSAAPAPAQAEVHRGLPHIARGELRRKALEVAGYLLLAYVVVKLLPGFETAFRELTRVSWPWIVAGFAVEILSEMGFVMSWRAIVDPENLLSGEGRGSGVATGLAWLQLGGGEVLPGGSLSGLGMETWILHRLGTPTRVIAERQFNLSFLNTGVDALALIAFGTGLAIAGGHPATLTLLPAGAAVVGIAGVLLLARRNVREAAERSHKHAKVATAIATLARAVDDTRQLLTHRGGSKSVLGAITYLGFDVLVLWGTFIAINADPVPAFAVVVLAYIIGALGGSLPLPAAAGAVGGMVGMLILYGVSRNPAVVAVIIYQGISQLVPLVGGTVAYLFLRRTRFMTARSSAE